MWNLTYFSFEKEPYFSFEKEKVGKRKLPSFLKIELA
jgi:hypothetical protein